MAKYQRSLIPAHNPKLLLQIKNHQDEVNQEGRSFYPIIVYSYGEFQAGRSHSIGQKNSEEAGPGVAPNCDESGTDQVCRAVGLTIEGGAGQKGEGFFARVRGHIF